jgi:hypothetical protein
VWFEFPAPEDGACASRRRFGLERIELVGLGLCAAAFALMALRPVSEAVYMAGMWVMLAGVATLLAQPFVTGVVVGGEAKKCPPDQSPVPPAPIVRGKAG